MGQQCRMVDTDDDTPSYNMTDGHLPDTVDNVPFHQERMMRLRDEEYARIQMRTCDMCAERRWWRNPTPNQPSIPQRYIKPLDEDNMYPTARQRKTLQAEFDAWNLANGTEPYPLSAHALEAAHRIKFTNTHTFTCAQCRSNRKLRSQKHRHWELYNKFNQMIPAPAPKRLQRLNPVERQMVARSVVVMSIHNRLHNTKRKQSRSTGHGCIVRLDPAAQIESIRHQLPRARDDLHMWHTMFFVFQKNIF